MTAHKHYEMIVAKAKNMDLVTLVKFGGEWMASAPHESGVILTFDDRYDYFLCLPQHKEACLHWLNSGKIQYKTKLVPDFQDYQPDIEFGIGSIFMQSDFEIRIKPRKEKRWIIAKPNALASMRYFKSERDAKDTVKYSIGEFKDGQVIEIEVEVQP